MTPDIATVFAILGVAVVLFVTEKLRVDVVALMVLVGLALTGLLTPTEALAGFSNPAVITVWAVFMLSGGLARTGVASMIGRQVLRLAGEREVGLIVAIMLTAGFLSAFMNNVGVAALMLPVVMDIARRTGRSPSKLLMPLAFSSLLGGLTTLIGTPPNLLISAALDDYGLTPFSLFDFTPVGLAVMLSGTVYMVLVGRRLLPDRDPVTERVGAGGGDLRDLYKLGEKLFVVRLPTDSVLDGRTLAECRLGSALGVNVIGILRDGRTVLAPDPESVLRSGDGLLVEGDLSRLTEIRRGEYLQFESDSLAIERLVSAEIEVANVELLEGSGLVGRNLRQIDFRNRFGAIVLAVRRGETARRTNLEKIQLEEGDVLLVQGTRSQLDRLREEKTLACSPVEEPEVYRLKERLMVLRVPSGSALDGKTLAESQLGDAFGLGIMGIVREGNTQLMPAPTEKLKVGDTLLVKGRREDLSTVQGIHGLEVDTEREPELGELESDKIGLGEAVLAPRSTLVGKTLVDLHFREKYGLNVIALSREGKVIRTNVRNLPLRFGDAVLLHGPRAKLKLLASEPDFVVLAEEVEEPLREEKAPLAALLMVGVVILVILGWLPIYIAAVTGAVGMVLTKCLTMDEAYHSIEWRAVFLIAGMLPMGIAMEKTGAASLITENVVGAVGGLGATAVLAALFVVTALGAQVMPTAAVAILVAPIALSTAGDLGLSPYALAMTVAMSASASFMSPVAHPANVLIMGPGRYRFTDYIRVGLPLTLICLLVVLLVLPIFWPVHP